MKVLIIGLCFLVASMKSSYAQQANGTPSAAEQEVINLSKQKWLWMADKKVDTLNGLFDDKCVFVHMGGTWGKTRELEVIKGGMIWYKKAEVYSSSVNIFGNTAFIHCAVWTKLLYGLKTTSNSIAVIGVKRHNGFSVKTILV